MDPHEGTPVQGVLQTTLIASDGTTTDALSNAMFVMGPEAGKELLATVPRSRGLWILGELESQHLVEWQWQDCAMNDDEQPPASAIKKAKEQQSR